MNQRDRMRQRFSRQTRIGAASFAPAVAPQRPSIELRIHELALIGADFTAHRQIADTVQSELARLLNDRGLWQQAFVDPARKSVYGAAVSIPRGASAKKIGGEVAGAIYGALRPERDVDRRER